MPSIDDRKYGPVLAGFALLLSACTATPPAEIEDLAQQGEQHWERVREEARAVQAPVSLERALALGLSRNLDLRARALEVSLSRSEQELASWEMLPSLTASAGYSYRDRVQASFSSDQVSGQSDPTPATAQERKRQTGSLDLSWNMLDMGLSWLSAKTHGDRALIEKEKLRRLVHSVTRDIVYAWDQALAYQRIEPRLAETRELVNRALARSKQLEASRLRDPVLVLEYRKSLLLIRKEINRIGQQMRQARDELARMLDFPAGVGLRLDPGSDLLSALPEIDATLQQWQMAALLNRPEVRGVFYEQRAADRSALQRTLQMFPSLVLNYGYRYDSNKFLLHNRWEEAGARISWDLLKLASWPAQRKRARLEQRVAKVSSELRMTAVLSQVAIAGKQVASRRETRCLGEQLLDIEQQRVSILASRQRQAALDLLTLVKARLDEVLVTLETALDRTDHRRSLLMLLSSSGVGITPDELSSDAVEDVASEIRAWVDEGMAVQIHDLFEEVEKHFPDVQAPEVGKKGGEKDTSTTSAAETISFNLRPCET